jgi:flagellin
VSTSVSNTTVGADDASQATYTAAAGAMSALNSMLDSQGIFFTAAATGDTGSGSAGITFTADDGTATDGYLATDPTATISGSSASVTERTAGSDAYSELGFAVAAGEAGGIKMSYKTVGSVDAPTITNAGSSVTVATTIAGVDAEVTAGNVADNVAARGDISFTGEVAGGDVVTVKINNNNYASFTLDNASASAINSNATHTPDLGGANDATGDPVIAQTAIAGVAAIYTMALNDTAANSLADGFAISDGTTNIAVADMSAVTSVAEVVAAIEADAAYSTLSYTISEAHGGLTFIAKMQTPIASAAEPTGTGLTTAVNTAGLAPVAAIKASEGMTFSGNFGFDVGTLSASVVNGKLRVSGSTANDVGTTPTFSMSNIEVSRGVHAPVGGADITTSRLASDALSILDNAIEGVNNSRARMGASMSRLDYASDNLQNVAQNSAAARSRVLDADYARETTELARTKIIQQAGMAMLSQANQDKQSVLSLLK